MPNMAADPLWEAFVEAVLKHGTAMEASSRFADKPAMFVAEREIAHYDGDGVVDVRVTAEGWESLPDEVRTDPTVHQQRRRDWVEIHLADPGELERLSPLLAAAVETNR